MEIAVIGWGSLIWNPGKLPLAGDWQTNGPKLPIEFARRSDDGRITLVITDGCDPVTTLWARLNVPSIEEAVSELAAREKTSRQKIGRYPAESPSVAPPQIIEWARQNGLDGAVWTNLGPRFGEGDDPPSLDEVLDYLSSLTPPESDLAEEYIRRAPRQIETPYRQAIVNKFGWSSISKI